MASLINKEVEEKFDFALSEASYLMLPILAKIKANDQNKQLIDSFYLQFGIEENIEFALITANADVILFSNGFPILDKSVMLREIIGNNPNKWQKLTTIKNIKYLFYRNLPYDDILVVAETNEERSEYYRKTIKTFILPLLLLIPIIGGMVYFITKYSLRPILQVSDKIRHNNINNLQIITMDNPPPDIVPIIDSFNDLIQKIKEAMAQESLFAANSAHELRTPLSIMLLQIDAILLQKKPNYAKLESLKTQIIQMSNMLQKLLQLSKIHHIHIQNNQRNNLCYLINLVVSQMSEPHKFICILPDKPVFSNIDIESFCLILRNLCENAYQHGDKNQDIIVELEENGKLSVINHGKIVNINEFQTYFTYFSKSSESQGHGLGLAIIYNIIKIYNLSYEIISPAPFINSGLKFSINFTIKPHDN